MNTPHSPFAVGKTTKLIAQACPCMSKDAHGCVLVSRNGADMYCGQSSSWSLFLVFLVSRLGPRGQLSWSVVLRGQSSFASWSDVVVSRSAWSVFSVVSLNGHRAQSSAVVRN